MIFLFLVLPLCGALGPMLLASTESCHALTKDRQIPNILNIIITKALSRAVSHSQFSLVALMSREDFRVGVSHTLLQRSFRKIKLAPSCVSTVNARKSLIQATWLHVMQKP